MMKKSYLNPKKVDWKLFMFQPDKYSFNLFFFLTKIKLSNLGCSLYNEVHKTTLI